MAHFEKEYFDEARFKIEIQELDEAVGKFEEAVYKLKEEGFPTDYHSIMQLSGFSDADFLNHVKELFNKYMDSLGFVIKSERKRIAGLYDAMYINSLPCVQIIRASLKKGLVIKKQRNGSFKIDQKETEEQAKQRCMISIDTEKWKNTSI